MTDQLISFETAKLAKEKGFDYKCYNAYSNEGHGVYSDESGFDKTTYTLAPTQSLLQAYLLEKYGLYATAHPYAHSDGYLRWEPVVQNIKHSIDNFFMNLILGSGRCKFQHKHIEAIEIALQEALKLTKS